MFPPKFIWQRKKMSEHQNKSQKTIRGKLFIGLIVLLILAGSGAGTLYYYKAQQMNLNLAQLVPNYIPGYLKLVSLPQSIKHYLTHPFWTMNENQETVKRIRYVYETAGELLNNFSMDKEAKEFLNQPIDLAVTHIDYKDNHISFLMAADIGTKNGVLAELFPKKIYQEINKNFSGSKTKHLSNGKTIWQLTPDGLAFPLYYCIYKNLLIISPEEKNLTHAITNEILPENQLVEDIHFQKFSQQLSPGQNIAAYAQAKTIYNDLVNQNILQDPQGLIGRLTGIRNIDGICFTSHMEKGIPLENFYLLVPEKTGLVKLLHKHAGKDRTSVLIPKQSVASVSLSISDPADLVWNTLDLLDQGRKTLFPTLSMDIKDLRDGVRMIQSFTGINLDTMLDDLLEGGISVYTDKLNNFAKAPRFTLIKYCDDPLKLDQLVSTLKDHARKMAEMRFVQTDDYKGDPIFTATSSERSLKEIPFYLITKGNYFLLSTAKDMLISAMDNLEKLPREPETDKESINSFLTMQGMANRYLAFATACDDPKLKQSILPPELEGILLPGDLAPFKINWNVGKDYFNIQTSPGILLPSLLTKLTHEALSYYYSHQKMVFEATGEKSFTLKPMFSQNVPIAYHPTSPGIAKITISMSEALPFTVSYNSNAIVHAQTPRTSAGFSYFIDDKTQTTLPVQTWYLKLVSLMSKEIECHVKIEQMDKKALEGGTEWVDAVTGMSFVWVPGGEFMMGSNDGASNEKPVHNVRLDGFYMGKYEVSNGEYRQYKGNHNSGSYENVSLSGDNLPAVSVSWEDTQGFIKWLNRKTGHTFALPTEAQWEYACRAGTTTERFWGDDPDQACKYANVHDVTSKQVNKFDGQLHNCDDGFSATSPVGSFQPNAFGLYDILGNVWEWSQDIYASDAYKKHNLNNPIYEQNGSGRVFRGGSWRNNPSYVRCACRYGNTPGDRNVYLGFRLLRTD